MPSSPIQKTHPHSNTPCKHLIQKACLLWQPPSLQHICIAVMQQSRDSVFHDRDTPIQLGLPWQSHTPVSVSILKLQASPIVCICI